MERIHFSPFLQVWTECLLLGLFRSHHAGRGKSTAFHVLPFVSCSRDAGNIDKTDVKDVDTTTCRSVVLVIAPLTAIMEQQTGFLQKCGVSAIHVLPSTPPLDLQGVADGRFSHVFLSPETIMAASERQRKVWRDTIAQLGQKLVAVVVDEAHLQVAWGREFRPLYAELGRIRVWTNAPILLMSATITHADFVKLLELWDLSLDSVSFIHEPCTRDNIHYSAVQRAGSLHERQEMLLDDIYAVFLEDATRRILVYCRRIEECSMLAERLSNRLQDLAVHAGDHSGSWRSCTVQAFHKEIAESAKCFIVTELSAERSHVRVVFATSALGCGADIRITDVIHNGPPRSMAELVQESGRAGRDGSFARSKLLWCPKELALCDHDVSQYCKSTLCKRALMAKVFDVDSKQHTTSEHCCDVCDLNYVDGVVADAPEDDDDDIIEFGIAADDTRAWAWWRHARDALSSYTQQLPTGMFTSGVERSGLTPDVMMLVAMRWTTVVYDRDLIALGVRADHAAAVFAVLSRVWSVWSQHAV